MATTTTTMLSLLGIIGENIGRLLNIGMGIHAYGDTHSRGDMVAIDIRLIIAHVQK